MLISLIVIVSSSAALQLLTTGAPVTILEAVKASFCISVTEANTGAPVAIADAVSAWSCASVLINNARPLPRLHSSPTRLLPGSTWDAVAFGTVFVFDNKRPLSIHAK